MKQFILSIIRHPAVRYAVVGVTNTIVDFSIYTILLKLGVLVYLAAVAGYMGGLTSGYFLSSKFVFASARSIVTYLKFGAVQFGGLGITLVVIYVLHGRFGVQEQLAKACALPITFVWSYLLSKRWVFAESATA